MRILIETISGRKGIKNFNNMEDYIDFMTNNGDKIKTIVESELPYTDKPVKLPKISTSKGWEQIDMSSFGDVAKDAEKGDGILPSKQQSVFKDGAEFEPSKSSEKADKQETPKVEKSPVKNEGGSDKGFKEFKYEESKEEEKEKVEEGFKDGLKKAGNYAKKALAGAGVAASLAMGNPSIAHGQDFEQPRIEDVRQDGTIIDQYGNEYTADQWEALINGEDPYADGATQPVSESVLVEGTSNFYMFEGPNLCFTDEDMEDSDIQGLISNDRLPEYVNDSRSYSTHIIESNLNEYLACIALRYGYYEGCNIGIEKNTDYDYIINEYFAENYDESTNESTYMLDNDSTGKVYSYDEVIKYLETLVNTEYQKGIEELKEIHNNYGGKFLSVKGRFSDGTSVYDDDETMQPNYGWNGEEEVDESLNESYDVGEVIDFCTYPLEVVENDGKFVTLKSTVNDDKLKFSIDSLDRALNDWKKHSESYKGNEIDDEITECLRLAGIQLNEDTIKQDGKWTNKGKEGTHGKFKTKKAADAQRKAMFANGYMGESEDLEEEITPSRFWKYQESPDMNFAIISAERGERTPEENAEKTEELKKDIKSKGYWYTEMKGGYVEQGDDGERHSIDGETSFVIPNMTKEEAIELGSKYDQDTVMFKDSEKGTLQYIYTNERAGKIGEPDSSFETQAGRNNFSVSSKDDLDYYSKLHKSNKPNMKIGFNWKG